MATPNPLEPVKGAGTTLWVYNGKGDAYANPLSDDDWQRLAKVKDLTPGEMSKRLVRTVLIFTESSDQLSRATDRVPGLPASPGYVQ